MKEYGACERFLVQPDQEDEMHLFDPAIIARKYVSRNDFNDSLIRKAATKLAESHFVIFVTDDQTSLAILRGQKTDRVLALSLIEYENVLLPHWDEQGCNACSSIAQLKQAAAFPL